MLFGWGQRRAAEFDSAGSRDAVVGSMPGSSAVPETAPDLPGDKRDCPRIPLPGEVRGEVMVFQPMRIVDLSTGGAMIETGYALQIDSLHDFRLSLGDRSVIVKGRIAYCHIGELTETAALYRMGVEFVEVSEPAQHAIGDFAQAMEQVGKG